MKKLMKFSSKTNKAFSFNCARKHLFIYTMEIEAFLGVKMPLCNQKRTRLFDLVLCIFCCVII